MLLILLSLVLGCSTPASQADAPAGAAAGVAVTPVRNIEVATLDADEKANKVPVLVDVRSPEEFASGHVPGARNIPLESLGARMDTLAEYKSGDVYVICQSGRRSSHAADQLSAAGFHAVNVRGGTGAWMGAGLPTE